VTAGSVDTIGFLGLGVFTAHITGNLVVAARRPPWCRRWQNGLLGVALALVLRSLLLACSSR